MSISHEVVVIGGINCDIIGKSFDKIVIATSNPGSIKINAGGVGRNIAQNLSQLGINTALLGSIGRDSFGDYVLKISEDAGINTEHIILSSKYKTGIYLAIVNDEGEMELALSDMSIIEETSLDYLKSKSQLIKDSKIIVCDTNIDKNSLSFLVDFAQRNDIPICIETVSVAKSKKLQGILKGVDIITPSKDELFSLTCMNNNDNDIEKASTLLLNQGVKNIVVTLGNQGLYLINHKGITHLPNFPAMAKDVTGAGDSLTAGIIYGLLKYKDMEIACKCGLAAASLTVSSIDTVSDELNETNLEKILAEFIS